MLKLASKSHKSGVLDDIYPPHIYGNFYAPLARQDLSVNPLFNRDFEICSELLPLNSDLIGGDDYQARSCVTTIFVSHY